MSTSRRNLVYPIVVIGIGIIMMLRAVGILPEGVGDLLQRSWAALLILFGLNMLLGDRIRYGNWIALVVVILGLGIVVRLGYEARADVIKTDYIETLPVTHIGDHIERIDVRIKTANTTVNFFPSADGERAISAEFLGSQESRVSITLEEDNNVVVFTLVEDWVDSIPNLRNYGKGALSIYLPAEVALDVDFSGQRGLATLDFRVLNVPRFRLSNDAGDIELYMPLQGVVFGDIISSQGNLRIVVPPENALRVTSFAQVNEVNQNVYSRDEQGGRTLIETRLKAEFPFILDVNIPNGTLTIQAPEEI